MSFVIFKWGGNLQNGHDLITTFFVIGWIHAITRTIEVIVVHVKLMILITMILKMT